MQEVDPEKALNEVKHFGIMGMKWGHHKSGGSSSGSKSGGNSGGSNSGRSSGGSKSGAAPHTTLRDKLHNRDTKILDARSQFASLQAKNQAAKYKYVAATTPKGKAAAAKVLKQNNEQLAAVKSTAKHATGKEIAKKVLIGVGTVGAAVALGALTGNAGVSTIPLSAGARALAAKGWQEETLGDGSTVRWITGSGGHKILDTDQGSGVRWMTGADGKQILDMGDD